MHPLAPINRRQALVLPAAALAARQAQAQAAAWPARPIRIVLPYPAGGGAEPVVRSIGAALTAQLGQPVVVDFRPGANGAIGTTAVARAPADGYTLLFVPGPPVVHNKLLYRNLPYDPEKDLVPLGKVGESPMLIAVNAKVPARTLQELLALARQKPGQLRVAHVGVGSMAHLSNLLIERQGNVRFNQIPYGTAQRMNDLLSGEIDMVVDLPTAYLPHIAAGKLAGIAVMTRQRFPTMPDIPTTAEGGQPAMLAEGWYGLYAPRGTPPEVVRAINRAMADYLRSPAGAQQMLQYALQATPGTPEEHQAWLRQEYGKWGPVIREANIQLE